MKVMNVKRDVFFGYVTLQLAIFGLPFLVLYDKTGNIWWGLGILGAYILNTLPVWQTMRNGIPTETEIVLSRFWAPPKSSTLTKREIYLRIEMMFAHKSLACGYAMLLFGVLVAYNTDSVILASIIATVGVFCTWQALKAVKYFAHIS